MLKKLIAIMLSLAFLVTFISQNEVIGMANKYANLAGNNKIRDEYKKINVGFDKVEADVIGLSGRINSVDNKVDSNMSDINIRVDQIITTPAEGVTAQEIIDARGGQAALGGRLDKVDSQLAEISQELIETNKYNDPSVNDYVYNLDRLSEWFSKLSSFRKGLAKTINVSIIGDSISEGNAAGNATPSLFFEKGYLGQLREKFKIKFGDAGRGFIPVYLTTNAPMWAFGSNWTLNTGWFGATGVSRQCSVNGDTATLQFNGTGIGILFPRRVDGGKLSISIDGGAPVIIDEYSASDIHADKYEITGLTNGAHTLVITSLITGTQKVWLHGAYEISSSTGIRFNMVGRSGIGIVNAATEAAMPTEIDIWEPTLTIIALTANDYGGQTDLATYETNLQTLITRAKAYGDVLLVSIGLEIKLEVETIPQVEYVKIQRKLADSNNIAFFDMYHLWSGNADFAKNKLGFIKDVVHPTDAGHTDIANKLYEVLTKNIEYDEVFTKKITVEDTGVLSDGVMGAGHYKKISKAYGHRQEAIARDLIVFDHAPPINSADSSTIIGTIRVSFAGRNTAGANAYAACEYDFYYDNIKNIILTQKSNYNITHEGATTTIELTKKEPEKIIQIKISPNAYALTGSVFVEINYTQSYNREPIIVKFSSDLI